MTVCVRGDRVRLAGSLSISIKPFYANSQKYPSTRMPNTIR